jgi:hypothetical protein
MLGSVQWTPAMRHASPVQCTRSMWSGSDASAPPALGGSPAGRGPRKW